MANKKSFFMKYIIPISIIFFLIFIAFKPKIQNWTPPPLLLNDCLNLPDDYFNYANIEIPNYAEGFAELNDNEPAANPTTDAGATLGRVLFYDKKLSLNDETACASCHLQENGFSDPEQFSIGFEGGLTGRNSMGLTHARYFPNGKFFWDERAETLEAQALMPIQDPVEMGMNLEDLEVKLASTEYYPPLFEDAFGDQTINSERIGMALAQFVRSIESYNSKYDLGISQIIDGGGMEPPNSQPFPNFTEQENLGQTIFFSEELGNCIACHTAQLFISPVSQNNGLEIEYSDNGIGEANGNNLDNGKFKVPSLRNIGLTAPYMHDGRFEGLDEVIQHYDNGVLPHPNLAPDLRVDGNGPPKSLGLDQNQKDALIAFLLTLTDSTMITDERWSDPFCTDTNTDDLALQNSIEIFPNPFSNKASILIINDLNQFKTLQIIDASGKILIEKVVSNNSIEIEKGSLLSGLYFVKMIGKNAEVVKRIMIE